MDVPINIYTFVIIYTSIIIDEFTYSYTFMIVWVPVNTYIQ